MQCKIGRSLPAVRLIPAYNAVPLIDMSSNSGAMPMQPECIPKNLMFGSLPMQPERIPKNLMFGSLSMQSERIPKNLMFGSLPMQPERIPKNLMPLVAQSARQWRRAIDRQLQPLGLTEATWLPLLHLSRLPQSPRQKDLAYALQLDGSSVVRLLDALQASGLIDRTEGQDRRAKTVALTDAGRAVVVQVEAVVDAMREKYLGGLPAKDLAVALSVVQQIVGMLAADQEAAQ